MKKRDRILALLCVVGDEMSAPQIADICGYWSLGGAWTDLVQLEMLGLVSGRAIPRTGPAAERYPQKTVWSITDQ